MRSNGRPKIAYPTLAEASVVAAAQTDPGRVAFRAYRCPYCPAFHVGRPRLGPATASEADWVELGERVIWHMRRQNVGPMPR